MGQAVVRPRLQLLRYHYWADHWVETVQDFRKAAGWVAERALCAELARMAMSGRMLVSEARGGLWYVWAVPWEDEAARRENEGH